MFFGGMRDPRRSDRPSEISFPEITSTALLDVMDQLYTDGLCREEHQYHEFPIKDWRSACDTMLAAKFFLVKKLADSAWSYVVMSANNYGADDKASMGQDYRKTEDDIQAIVKSFSVVVEYAFDEVFDPILRFFISRLVFAPLKPEHLQGLSHNALLHFLEMTRTPSSESTTNLHVLTLTEFGRFRTMVLWCACKKFASESPLPCTAVSQEIACTLALLGKPSIERERITCEQRDMYNKVKGRLTQAVQEYLPLINFEYLAPNDLNDIVVPMEVVPSSDIMAAVEFQRLQRPFEDEVHTLGWSGDDIYEPRGIYEVSEEDGCQIQQCVSGKGYSYCRLCADSRAGGVYEWEITIEEVCDPYIEIGLLFSWDKSHLYHSWDLGDDYKPCERSRRLRRKDISLSEEYVDGYAFRRDSTGMSIDHRSYIDDKPYGKDCSQLVYGRHYANKDSKVKIRLDMSKAECSFSVDNEDFGVAWNDSRLKTGVYYPAVSLGERPSGAIRIRVLRVGQWDFTVPQSQGRESF